MNKNLDLHDEEVGDCVFSHCIAAASSLIQLRYVSGIAFMVVESIYFLRSWTNLSWMGDV